MAAGCAKGCTGGAIEVLVGGMIGEAEQHEIDCTKGLFGGKKSSVGVPRCDIGGVVSSQGKCDMLLAVGHPLCMGDKLDTKPSVVFNRTRSINSAQSSIKNTKQSKGLPKIHGA